MQLNYLLVVVVVSDVSDVKVMSSTVAVIFAITRVVNNYNIRTEPLFLNRTEPNTSRTDSVFFSKTEPKPNQSKKKLFRTSLLISRVAQ